MLLLATWPVLAGGDWIRAGLTTNVPLWGLRGGLQFAIPPAGFTGGDGGPRGLIRLGYPTLAGGGYDLINFIAIEPVVDGRRGYSELERSGVDGRPGKLLWTGEAEFDAQSAKGLDPGTVRRLEGGVEELTVTVHVERFDNGARVRLELGQRSDAPDELRLTVHAHPESVAIDLCILTATMGNKARARLLLLRDGPVSSQQLWPEYREAHFTRHAVFGLDRLPRASNGDVLVPMWTDELEPSGVAPFGAPHFWDYRGRKVTQYWRRPVEGLQGELVCAVNGRYTYWMSERPIPGGISFENFELREPFESGQTFVFGITDRIWPLDLEPVMRQGGN